MVSLGYLASLENDWLINATPLLCKATHFRFYAQKKIKIPFYIAFFFTIFQTKYNSINIPMRYKVIKLSVPQWKRVGTFWWQIK